MQASSSHSRPLRVQIDDAAIAANTRALRQVVGSSVALIGVVKAQAYGHGALVSARAMLRGGATRLAVSSTAEGRKLRESGIHAPILVLGHTPPERVGDALAHDLALMVGDVATLRAAAQAGRAAGKRVALHLKVDTGMHRLGLLPNDVAAFLHAARDEAGVEWQGIFTHFATADEPTHPALAQQLRCFNDLLALATTMNWRFPLVHAGNSAAALWHPAARFDAVRAGIALYGVSPSAEISLPPGFQPAMALHSYVTRIAELPPGSAVSYGARYRTTKTQRIATVAAGYADGVRRSPPWREVLVRGQRAPIVGRICMDYTMIDVTHIAGAAAGDEATLLGSQGEGSIGAHEVAEWLGTSAYEVLTSARQHVA